MKPFARINLSSVLSSVALAKGKPWRRGTLCVGGSSSHPFARCGGANQKCVQRLKRLKIEVIFIKEVK